MNYSSLLKNKKKKIAVWGCGFIGLSTLLHFANKGVKGIGFDINKEVIYSLKKRKLHIHNLENWLGFSAQKLIKSNLIDFTSKFNDVLNNEDVICHFISVPTEQNGKPYLKPIKWVLDKISKFQKKNKNKVCVIVESTLVPKTTDKYLKKIFRNNKNSLDNFYYCVAPRRDWFETKDKNLKTLHRIFGCNSKSATKEIFDILKIVTNNLHAASSYKISEFVKAIENSYRHVEITLANQLAFAFPKDNIREVLALAGTKWNMNTYYPGFGTGGYCIPLSSQYVLEGAGRGRSQLTLLKDTVLFDQKVNERIADYIIKRKTKKVLILGLSYKSDVKVSILSPTINLYNFLKRKKISTDVYDPLFDKSEIKDILKAKYLSNFDFNQYDCVIYMVNHKINEKEVINKIKLLKNKVLFIDNTGYLAKHEKTISKLGSKLLVTGEPNWLY